MIPFNGGEKEITLCPFLQPFSNFYWHLENILNTQRPKLKPQVPVNILVYFGHQIAMTLLSWALSSQQIWAKLQVFSFRLNIAVVLPPAASLISPLQVANPFSSSYTTYHVDTVHHSRAAYLLSTVSYRHVSSFRPRSRPYSSFLSMLYMSPAHLIFHGPLP